MPTGYTAAVAAGTVTELPDFVMSCARAMGALITMRDAPADAPVPETFEPSTIYRDWLEAARERLAVVTAWTAEAAHQASQADFAKRQMQWDESHDRSLAEVARHEAMLAKVRAWTPPTSEHTGLKDFMVSQLEDSIAHDAPLPETSWPRPEQPLSAAAFKSQELERAHRDIARYEKLWREEQERAVARTEWVRALRASLGSEVAS